MTSFIDAAVLSKYEQGEDAAGGQAYTVKKSKPGRFTAVVPPSCHACYRPLEPPRGDYCAACEASGADLRHRRMVGRMQ